MLLYEPRRSLIIHGGRRHDRHTGTLERVGLRHNGTVERFPPLLHVIRQHVARLMVCWIVLTLPTGQ